MRNEESVVVEEGQALEALEPRGRSRSRAGTEEVDVLVIGGGQAGLSVGYHLARCGGGETPHPRRQRAGR
jgi:ribulose 1,5-bisphosphate synthetase/thiazole synthase